MDRPPKRLPGEANPQGKPVANPDWDSGGRGNDYGIARGVVALAEWWKRRKAVKGRQR